MTRGQTEPEALQSLPGWFLQATYGLLVPDAERVPYPQTWATPRYRMMGDNRHDLRDRAERLMGSLRGEHRDAVDVEVSCTPIWVMVDPEDDSVHRAEDRHTAEPMKFRTGPVSASPSERAVTDLASLKAHVAEFLRVGGAFSDVNEMQ